VPVAVRRQNAARDIARFRKKGKPSRRPTSLCSIMIPDRADHDEAIVITIAERRR
jgi:hypothetical protein